MPFSSKPFDFVESMAGNLYFYPDWLFNHAPQADTAARLSGQSLRRIPIYGLNYEKLPISYIAPRPTSGGYWREQMKYFLFRLI